MVSGSIAARPDPMLNAVQVRVRARRFNRGMNANPLRVTSTLALAIVVAGLTACGSSSKPASPPSTTSTPAEPVIDPGDGGNYNPEVDPANFVRVVDNPYMPFVTGSTWRYEGTSEGEAEVVEITVTNRHKRVMGVDTVVVRDVVKVDGEVVEDTDDWFAQDKDGNVWYFGEQVKDFENGKLVSTAGSWEAGVDGALPGIVMPAVPKPGDAYRQEYYKGEAEDMMKITSVGQRAVVPAGSYSDVVVTVDWTPLEPDVVERKSYAKGVGRISEEKTAGSQGRSELVEYRPAP
jgi:hypothetical protein